MLRRLLLSTLTSLSVLAIAASAVAVGTRRFVLDKEADFKGGDLKGVAVDSGGRVRAGFNLGSLPASQVQSIWSALPQKDGSVLLGTGNEGKLLKLSGGAVSVLAETKSLAVTSLAFAWGGAVALGTLPDGKLMKWERGKLADVATLKGAQHIFPSPSTPSRTPSMPLPAPRESSSASRATAARRFISTPKKRT